MIAQTDLSDVLDRYRAGEPLASIAADYDVTPQAISQLAHRAGAPKRPKGKPRRPGLDARVDEMVRLYRAGWTSIEIGARFGCGHSAVTMRLREAGVHFRASTGGCPPAFDARSRIQLLADHQLGHTYKELASDHGVHPATVKRHIAAERERLAKHSSPTPQMTPGWRRRGRRGGDT